jgi:hypothetical protein
MGKFMCFLLGVLVGLICLTVIIVEKNEPSAMDVYKGKTTLEYTVVNGIKTDSTVIWNRNK